MIDGARRFPRGIVARFRWATALLFLYVLVERLVDWEGGVAALYMTHLTFAAGLAYFASAAWAIDAPRGWADRNPRLDRFLGLVWSLAIANGIALVAIYWTMLEPVVTTHGIVVHGLNIAFLSAEYVLGETPIRAWDTALVSLLDGSYVGLAYFVRGVLGRTMYPFLGWEPGVASGAILSMIALATATHAALAWGKRRWLSGAVDDLVARSLFDGPRRGFYRARTVRVV